MKLSRNGLTYSLSDHAAQRIIGRGLSIDKVRRAVSAGEAGRSGDLLTYTDRATGYRVLIDPMRGCVVTAYYRPRVVRAR